MSTYEENYNSPALVEIWGDFIDWNKRRQGESGFLVNTLKKHGCKRVLDACLGDGCDSIHLLKNSFEVVSNEIDSLFIQKALLNARRENVTLQITGFDWREIHKKLPPESSDAITLLGNSLTYLFKKKDQLAALRGFHHILRHKGILIIDERNYQRILDHKKEMLSQFSYSKKYVYCGEKVTTSLETIKPKKIIFKYTHENGLEGRLQLYPFQKGELENLLKEAGFESVTRFSDYKKSYSKDVDFYQYVAIKEK